MLALSEGFGLSVPPGVLALAEGLGLSDGVVVPPGRQPVNGKWWVSAPPLPVSDLAHTEPLTGPPMVRSKAAFGARMLPGQATLPLSLTPYLTTLVAVGKFHSSLARSAPPSADCSLSSRTYAFLPWSQIRKPVVGALDWS